MHKSSLDRLFFDHRPTRMLNSPIRPPRPRLTGKLFLYGLVDVFGLSCVAIGGSWFFAHKPVLFRDFPTSTVEAVACAAGGIAVMIWAVGHIYQEMGKQAPAVQADIDAHVAERRRDDDQPDA